MLEPLAEHPDGRVKCAAASRGQRAAEAVPSQKCERGMSSPEEALVAQVRAGQEQTNRRLEALLAAIHQLSDLVARLVPPEDDPRLMRPQFPAWVDHQTSGSTPNAGGSNLPPQVSTAP
jgi:hypothetical protein